MDTLSAAILIKALDGLSLRSVATAQNVANAGTLHYRPVRVTFEQALAAAAEEGPDAVRALQPRLEASVADDRLRVDLELATAQATSGRYAALVEVLNRELQLRAIATRGTL